MLVIAAPLLTGETLSQHELASDKVVPKWAYSHWNALDFRFLAHVLHPFRNHLGGLRTGSVNQAALRQRVGMGAPSAVKPLFIAQMAAWVRLLTSILRSRVFRWTLTVASVMPSLIAIILLLAPVTRAWRISCSRGDRPRIDCCGARALMS